MNKETKQLAIILLVAAVWSCIGYSIGHDYGLNEGRNEGYYDGYIQCEIENDLIDLRSDWATWHNQDWDNKKNITLEKNNNTVSNYYFYYSNKYGMDSHIGNYRLNGEFNLEDEDSSGKCWSYNGSDESDSWRIIEIEDNIQLRRCSQSIKSAKNL